MALSLSLEFTFDLTQFTHDLSFEVESTKKGKHQAVFLDVYALLQVWLPANMQINTTLMVLPKNQEMVSDSAWSKPPGETSGEKNIGKYTCEI